MQKPFLSVQNISKHSTNAPIGTDLYIYNLRYRSVAWSSKSGVNICWEWRKRPPNCGPSWIPWSQVGAQLKMAFPRSKVRGRSIEMKWRNQIWQQKWHQNWDGPKIAGNPFGFAFFHQTPWQKKMHKMDRTIAAGSDSLVSEAAFSLSQRAILQKL